MPHEIITFLAAADAALAVAYLLRVSHRPLFSNRVSSVTDPACFFMFEDVAAQLAPELLTCVI
jgi:hypothetical protein